MGFPEECLANASGSLDRTLCLDIRRMLDVCILPQTIYIERVESKMRVELGSQTMMGHVAAEDIKRNVCLPLRNGGELFGLCFMEHGNICTIYGNIQYMNYLDYSAWQCSGNTKDDFDFVCRLF